MGFVNLSKDKWRTTVSSTGSALTCASNSSDDSRPIFDTGHSVLADIVPTVQFSLIRYPKPWASISVSSDLSPSGKVGIASEEVLEDLTDELPSFGIDVDINIASKKIVRIRDMLKGALQDRLADPTSATYQAAQVKLRLFMMMVGGENDPEKHAYKLDGLYKLYAWLDSCIYEESLGNEWEGTVTAAEKIRDEEDEPHPEAAVEETPN